MFIPKYRRKVFYGRICKDLGRDFATLARQKECRIEAGSLQLDHVHMQIHIPPKLSVSQVIGYIKGKSAIYIVRTYRKRECIFVSKDIWQHEYCLRMGGCARTRGPATGSSYGDAIAY